MKRKISLALQAILWLGIITFSLYCLDSYRNSFASKRATINSIPTISIPQANQIAIEDTVVVYWERDTLKIIKYLNQPLKLNDRLYIYR